MEHILTLFSYIIWIFTAVCWWKVFNKANIAGWKAIIPFYSDYIRYKLVGKSNMYWIYLLLSLGKQVFSWISVVVLAANLVELITTGNVNETGMEMKIFGWILTIIMILLDIYIGKHIANRFGKSEAFGVGIGLIPIVFVPILAFGNAEYSEKEWI